MSLLQKVAKIDQIKAGDLIHPYKQLDTTVYMIMNGEARTTIKVGASEIVGPTIEQGRLFGGLGLVRGNEKRIQVLACEDCTLLRVGLKELNDFRQKEVLEGPVVFQDVLERVYGFNQFLVKFLEDKGLQAGSDFYSDSVFVDRLAPEDEASYIMDKSFKCPICQSEFKASVIRGTKLKMSGPGDFFMNHYEHIEPLWYTMVTCDNCGFTEKADAFEDEIKYNLDKIRQRLEQIRDLHPIGYSQPRNLEEVMNGYVMYMMTAKVRELDDRMRARGMLMMYEVLMRSGFKEEAMGIRDEAFGIYSGMFKGGILDVNDMQLQQLYLILGKLHEHRGEFDEAKGAFRNAKMVKGVKDTRFIEMADDFLVDLGKH